MQKVFYKIQHHFMKIIFFFSIFGGTRVWTLKSQCLLGSFSDTGAILTTPKSHHILIVFICKCSITFLSAVNLLNFTVKQQYTKISNIKSCERRQNRQLKLPAIHLHIGNQKFFSTAILSLICCTFQCSEDNNGSNSLRA
jgi:hypothetical protein